MPTTATRVAARALRALPRAQFSRVVGWLSDREGPTPLVRAAVRTFTAVYGVNLQEAEAPPEGWRSLDAFFTRRLISGARPFPSDLAAVPSPADGRLSAAGTMGPGATFDVKGRRYGVDDLLARPGAAADYAGGAYAVVYLAPPDYHRVHASFGGEVVRAFHVPGEHYPVNRLGERLVPDLLARNERLVVEQSTAEGGRVATVLVGAVGVRRIRLACAASAEAAIGVEVARGAELGVFHLGSTVVVMTSFPVRIDVPLGDRVHAGETLGLQVAPPRGPA